MRTWPTQRKKSILSQTKSRFLLSFYFFSLLLSPIALFPHSLPLPFLNRHQQLFDLSGSPRSTRHKILHWKMYSPCKGWSIQIIRDFPRVLISLLWPTLLSLPGSILVQLCKTRLILATASQASQFPAPTKVTRRSATALSLPLDKESNKKWWWKKRKRNDELGLRR